MIEKLRNSKNRAHAALMAFAMAMLVPGLASADGMADVIEPKITVLVADIASIAAVVVLVVIGVVSAKLVFNLLKKA